MTSDNGITRRQEKAIAKLKPAFAGSEQKRSKDEMIANIMAMMQKGPVQTQDEVSGESFTLTTEEMAAVRDYLGAEPLPKFKKLGSLPTVYPDHPSRAVGQALIAKALGITDETFYAGALKQLINASTEGSEIDVEALNFAVSLVRSIEPRSQLETMLAIQMAAVHLSSMKYMRKMNHAETIPQLDLQERVVNKLMRTFTSQMEALRKHRNGGNQKVVVEHVHVYQGGQAIVGNVNHGGRPSEQGVMQSHGQGDLSLPVSAAVHGDIEANEIPMPGSGRAGKDGLSVPRSQSGSAEG